MAIRWGVKKYRHFLLGAPRFRVVTDHKPLTTMFNKVTGEVPPRIERFIMDLQEFDFVVTHRAGKDCIADFLSRNHSTRTGSSPARTLETTVNQVIEAETCHAIREDTAITAQQVRETAANCIISQKVMQAIKTGVWSQDPDLKTYLKIKDQLSIIEDIACKGSKIIIPPALQKQATKLCHRAHLGMSKAKAFARSFCWFPGIDE